MASTRDKLNEVRFHGRGGQGVVTAAKLLAEAAMKEGKYFQALPDYGGERMGAPVRAYTRISSTPIILHCQVTEPDIVVVIDPTLIEFIDVTEGLQRNGATLVINTPLSPDEVRKKISLKGGRVATVNATHIALHFLRKNIPNTPMLGALVKAIPIVQEKSLIDTIKHKLEATMSSRVAEANREAFVQACHDCQIG